MNDNREQRRRSFRLEKKEKGYSNWQEYNSMFVKQKPYINEKKRKVNN